MYYRGFIACIAFALLVLVTITSGPGCANIIPPEGGFRDTIPPAMTRANPGDSTLNFSGNKISFTFDEYVQLDNFQQNVLITPVPKLVPAGSYKLNTVSVRLRDTLEPNTTYTINFGNAIKDVNEGNVMKEFTYVFSTGSSIDSLTFSGNVLIAETGKPDSTLTVMLHKNSSDSVVLKERPRYVAKLDGKGFFTFRNLPPGTFYVYAMKDDSRLYRYNPKQLFAFADSPVVVQSSTAPVTLYAYTARITETTTTSPAVASAKNVADKRIKFQTTINSNRHDLLKPFSITFERPLRLFDSSKIRFVTDTVYSPVSGYSWTMDSTRKKLTLNYSWLENTLYHFIVQKDFATDTLGHQLLRADTVSFTTMKATDYGQLNIRFRNLDLSTNPVLQFVQSDAVVSSFPLTGSIFSEALFVPGEYQLRILYDTNRNGQYDPGDFFGKHIQPERVKPVERRINVKPNWENQMEINL